MRTDEFDYDLPAKLIAQTPLPNRDESRLLVLRRTTGTLEHRVFRDLPDLLSPGDLLILNDTKVVAARLRGRRARTGGRWEGLFLTTLEDGTWEIMSQTRGRLSTGEEIAIEPPPLKLTLLRKTNDGTWIVAPSAQADDDPYKLLDQVGEVPLPPYIRRGHSDSDDKLRYQTVYAQKPGAVAAPTAGLHFTPSLFELLTQRGVDRAFVTLHVGGGTFQPIKAVNVSDHHIHCEWGQITSAAVNSVSQCKQQGGRVIAVGTTSVRVLESAARIEPLAPTSGPTDLFIYPPFPFRIVDGLITNFHLPRSSLLVLVSAFAGIDLIRHAYQEAVAREYRFYSYGDAMLIL